MTELPDIIAKLLGFRGIPAAEFERFLNPSLRDLPAPETLPGVAAAADVLLGAVRARRPIVVFGDYDCDGVCATAILVRALETIGGVVHPFLPDRLTEGYGMSEASVTRMLAEYPDVALVVTVDNGINALEPVAELKARGVGTVVTDHHLPGDELPAADVVVDPKVDAPEDLKWLCGAGVAFLLASRLVAEAKRLGLYAGDPFGGPLLVMTGLATVADIMPLHRVNRIFVSEALRHFATWAPPGLRELLNRAARKAANALSSRDFGFMIAPRLNAAGRLASIRDEYRLPSGMRALELLLAEDREIVRELARLVDGYNLERKAIEQRMADAALAKVVPGAPAQVIDLPDGHPGVAGIVAARVLDRLAAQGGAGPVCVIAGDHGSARAPDGINIRDAFVACSDYLERFGGHAAAGGFSVREGMTDRFRQALCDYCSRLNGGSAATKAPLRREPELWISPQDITLELAEALRQLEPFGEANPEPVFGLRGMILTDVRPFGADGRHLQLSLRGTSLTAIQWCAGDQVERLRAASSEPHDVLFTLAVSTYGERHVELRLVDCRPANMV